MISSPGCIPFSGDGQRLVNDVEKLDNCVNVNMTWKRRTRALDIFKKVIIKMGHGI